MISVTENVSVSDNKHSKQCRDSFRPLMGPEGHEKQNDILHSSHLKISLLDCPHLQVVLPVSSFTISIGFSTGSWIRLHPARSLISMPSILGTSLIMQAEQKSLLQYSQ